MKLKPPKNPNYAATVVEIKTVNELEGCDNVVGTPLLGYQAIVSRSTQPGDKGIVFTAETQLSDEYASENNLFRHPELNKDKDAKGYLEDNRRIKALKFRGHRSDALFMPLGSLSYTGVNPDDLQVGDSFDEINGHEICKKYEIKRKSPSGQPAIKVASRVDDKFFPKHFDTENYFKFADSLRPDTLVSVTQKLHGTSLRVAHIPVARKLSWLERLAVKLGVQVRAEEYAIVYGSRNMTKDANNPEQKNFYSSDIWSLAGKEFDVIPKGFMVFAEIIGWTPEGAEIQKGYTYRLPHGTFETYVYRVAQIGPSGTVVDLSWQQVKEFCDNFGFRYVPEIDGHVYLASFNPQDYLDKKFNEEYRIGLALDPKSPCDEGVCIRVEGLTPKVFKAKSPKFLQFETRQLDKEVTDLESEA